MTQEGQALPCSTQTENLVEPDDIAADLPSEPPHEGRLEASDITGETKEEEEVGEEAKETDREDAIQQSEEKEGAEGEQQRTKGEAGETTEAEEGGESEATHPPTEDETSDPRLPERWVQKIPRTVKNDAVRTHQQIPSSSFMH